MQELLQFLCLDEDGIEEGTDHEVEKFFQADYTDSESSDSESSGAATTFGGIAYYMSYI